MPTPTFAAMQGPPPSAAGPSSTPTEAHANTPHASPHADKTVAGKGPHAVAEDAAQSSTFVFQNTPPDPSQSPQYYPAPPRSEGTNQPAGYAYYNYPSNAWGNPWAMGAYPYGTPGAYSYPFAPAQNASQAQPQAYPAYPAAPAQPQKPTSPSPSPPPEFHRDWDAIVKKFLQSIGFTQALKGFEDDMVILNSDWERQIIPTALGELMKDLLSLGQSRREDDPKSTPKERSLEERKLDYVHIADGAQRRSHTSTIKSISRFLAENRARNDASNRTEFLQSLAEKRRRLNEEGASEPVYSCARADAKSLNRELQMKYDIAKNEDGPLRRTLKSGSVSEVKPESATAHSSQPYFTGSHTLDLTAERYPALDERLRNAETHLAVRYVPSPPHSLLDRIKFLEDHIVLLEKEYPPWAALHFNQPRRGWPPPPRPTPIIVPSHLTSSSSTASKDPAQGPHSTSPTFPNDPGQPTDNANDSVGSRGKAKPGRQPKSSLHRAVMEKLEVQKAMNDLAGVGEPG